MSNPFSLLTDEGADPADNVPTPAPAKLHRLPLRPLLPELNQSSNNLEGTTTVETRGPTLPFKVQTLVKQTCLGM